MDVKRTWQRWVMLLAALTLAISVAFVAPEPSASQKPHVVLTGVPSLPAPYQHRYLLSEWWPVITSSTLWRTYAKANPVESAFLDFHANRKINQQADFLPINSTHTITGNALLMVLLTMTA